MRNIPAALQAHLSSGVTTTCRLLKLMLSNGEVYGLATLDRDIVYQGVTYVALQGFDSSVIATDSAFSVDNSEATALLAAQVPGITVEKVLAGALDDAQWEMMLVNWADTSMGAMVLDKGDVGEVKVIDGLIYVPELLSYIMRLRQAIGDVWSRRCRATFGTPSNSQHGCGVDASLMWIAGTVDNVDANDSGRVFTDTTISGPVDYFPGRVQWLTGNNASARLHIVEAYSTVSNTIVLLEPTAYAIQVGDTFRIRPDCNKSPSQCVLYGNFINYKGEPFIPVGDGLETMTPSAQVFGGMSGSTIQD